MAVKSGDRGSVISPRFVMECQLPFCYASVAFPDSVAARNTRNGCGHSESWVLYYIYSSFSPPTAL